MNEKNKKELMILIPKLRRYCYALTNNKDLGDDLLHDSIVKILSKFDFLKIDNFQAYIYRLISNTWKDNLRKKYTRNEVYAQDVRRLENGLIAPLGFYLPEGWKNELRLIIEISKYD